MILNIIIGVGALIIGGLCGYLIFRYVIKVKYNEMIAGAEKDNVYSLRYASLILAGHYNGGQWRIPFVGAIYVPELGWFPKDQEIQGLSYVNGIPQYISPGMGSDPHYEHQPGRVFNNPVITKITLTRKAER